MSDRRRLQSSSNPGQFEITPEAAESVDRMLDAGDALESQSIQRPEISIPQRVDGPIPVALRRTKKFEQVR